ncbi:hypothetical protein [Deinococcus altitudinis]|uniref:DUF3846 domain-containing protein n=1 Tax=Deinococcus altitudinis TaxID=468914 RepID=UPI003892C333
MNSVFLVVQPNGRVDVLPWPHDEDAQLAAIQEAVGGWVERVAEAFHLLDVHQAWINEDGTGRLPENLRADVLIGMDAEYALPCGPVVITPMHPGHNNRADRAHQCRFFGTLDAVALGLVRAADAGIGPLIDCLKSMTSWKRFSV